MNLIQEIFKTQKEGVEWKSLGEVAILLNGYNFKAEKYSKEGIRVIRISDVQKGNISDKDIKFYPFEERENFKKFLLQEGDLLISLTGNVGRVAMVTKNILPAGVNQRVACIRGDEKIILNKFLFYYFGQDEFENLAMKNATGGGQKNLSTNWLLEQKIPIPPLHIQEEIVRVLDAFTSLQAELQAELQARKKQYNYYLNDLLTPKNLPVWEEDFLGNICKNITDGSHNPPKENKEFGNIPMISAKNINNGIIDFIDARMITEEDFERENKRAKLEKDDVLLTIVGSIGRVAIVGDDAKVAFQRSVCILKPNKEKVISKFLKFFLETQKVQDFFEKNANGSAQKGIYLKQIKELPISFPNLQTQEKIVNVLDNFEKICNDLKIGLPAEMEARKKQYEYYREQLLTFNPAEGFTHTHTHTRFD